MQRSSGLPGAALRTAPAAGRIVSARASERLPIAEDHSCVRAARFYPSHVGPARSARLISAERFRALIASARLPDDFARELRSARESVGPPDDPWHS
jgi:hypothetical protein